MSTTAPTVPAPLLLKVGEAASMLSMGVTMTWELIASGQLASVKIGSARRVPIDAIHAYVAQLRAEAEAGTDGCTS